MTTILAPEDGDTVEGFAELVGFLKPPLEWTNHLGEQRLIDDRGWEGTCLKATEGRLFLHLSQDMIVMMPRCLDCVFGRSLLLRSQSYFDDDKFSAFDVSDDDGHLFLLSDTGELRLFRECTNHFLARAPVWTVAPEDGEPAADQSKKRLRLEDRYEDRRGDRPRVIDCMDLPAELPTTSVAPERSLADRDGTTHPFRQGMRICPSNVGWSEENGASN